MDSSAIRQNLPLASLSGEALAVLLPHLAHVTFRQYEVLLRQDDPVEHVYFPVEGMLSGVQFLSDGSGLEAAPFGRRGIAGAVPALGLGEAQAEWVVQVPGSAFRIGAEQLRKAAQDDPAIRKMIDVGTDLMLAHTFQSAACLVFHPVEARLCRWLLTSRDETGLEFLPLTQEFLAQMLGVQRTTVTVAARMLHDAGLINYRRGKITLTDIGGLEESACECYGTLRQRYARAYPRGLGRLEIVS